MGKKKPSKAKKRVKALKRAEPTSVIADDTDWSQFEPEELKTAPHSFIIYRGKVGRYMKELMRDLRKVMEPFTASNLKMKKGNVLKDYVSIASYFHVTHLCILTRTVVSPYLKICKIPRGPTLTFRILNYTLARDVLSTLRKQVTFEAQFLHQPLLIMNNFSAESQTLDLVSKTFQNMFPSINVNKVRLSEIRRVLLLNYIEEDDTIELRHYTITFKTTGVSKAMKKILISKNGKIPNLGRCTDIADFISRDGEISESEAEDNTENVEVSQKMGVKVSKGLEEVGVKLVELGPRLKMQLIKVEEGLCEGEVLYHKIVDKTPEEKLFIRQQRNLKKKMKLARKREQELNVEKKKREKEEHKKKCLRGMGSTPEQTVNGNAEEDDDADWYRKEVGEDPDEDTFQRKQSNSSQFSSGRKRKFNDRDRDGDNNERPFKTGRVSKFAKVKEKARLMKKMKQKGMSMGSKRKDRGFKQDDQSGFNRGGRDGPRRSGGERNSRDGPNRGGGGRYSTDGPNRSGAGGRNSRDGPNRRGAGGRNSRDGPSRGGGGRFSTGGPNRNGAGGRNSRDGPNRNGGNGPGGRNARDHPNKKMFNNRGSKPGRKKVVARKGSKPFRTGKA